jgi:hypothetical protein
VTFELEDAPVVGADALEHAVAVEQAVIEDADRGLGRRSKRAAHIDETVVERRRAGGGRSRCRLAL